MVVIYHHPHVEGHFAVYTWIKTFGWIGVDLFFVLSGYLISLTFFHEFKSGQSQLIKRFFLKRAFRILPPYCVVLGLYFLFPILREHPKLPSFWKFATFTQNFGLIRSSFSHAWSLCVEEHFYLLFPFTAFFFLTKKRKWPTLCFLGILLLFGLTARYLSWSSLSNPSVQYDQWIYYPTYNRLDGILFGVCLASLQSFCPQLWAKSMFPSWKRELFSWTSFFFCSIGAFFLLGEKSSLNASLFVFPLLSLSFALLIILGLRKKSFPFKRPLPGAFFLAKISYSIYLVHKIVISLLEDTFRGYGGLHLLISSVIIIFAGWLLFELVERPFMKWRKKILSEGNEGLIS